MFKSPRGLKDILPEEIFNWRRLEEKTRETFFSYGYLEIRTPILEELRLFSHSLGKTSEIMEKQIFTIKRGKEDFALRPEGTAPIIRAYLEHRLFKKEKFIKLYYIGPMFRAERPQKGRLREFYHIGAEAIGSDSPYLDAEIISLCDRFLKEIDISDYEIKMNSLGCIEDKKKFALILRNRLKDKISVLCQNCQRRFSQNILRILDCKNQDCKEIIRDLNLGAEHLCKSCSLHFKKVTDLLDELKIGYLVIPSLVRGLDYYTKTVFEITHRALGSQDAVCAGGRYNNLIRDLGGPDIPGIGLAFGMERLLLVQSSKFKVQSSKGISVYIVTLGEEAKEEGFILLDRLRDEGISSEIDYEDRSLKGQMRRASNLGTRFTIILGEDELKEERVSLKDMQTGTQKKIKIADLIKELKNKTPSVS